MPVRLYPAIANVRLTDYKVRVLDSKKGTAAKVRVLIEWSDTAAAGPPSASPKTSSKPVGTPWWTALRLELMRLLETEASADKVVAEFCWEA